MAVVHWLEALASVAVGYATLWAIGRRIGALLPRWGGALLWVGLSVSALAGTLTVYTVLEPAIYHGDPFPNVFQLLAAFFFGAVAWPVVIAWLIETRDTSYG